MNIKEEIEKADRLESKIDAQVMSELTGLSSPRVRHLLNNLAAHATNYLEVGCYLGGTLRAALHNNEHLTAYAVDNFSMEPKKRDQFFENTKMLKFKFIEDDSFNVDLTLIPTKIDCYFYDAFHSVDAQRDALLYYKPILADEFIYIVDDWDSKKVKIGTQEGLRDFQVIEQYELLGGQGDNKLRDQLWWGGLFVARVRK